MSATFSAIATMTAHGWPESGAGNTDTSIPRSPSMPCTRHCTRLRRRAHTYRADLQRGRDTGASPGGRSRVVGLRAPCRRPVLNLRLTCLPLAEKGHEVDNI